jgi:D-alanine-D-alanine ligase
MKVLILHDHVESGARQDERDVLVQARAICSALEELGHEWMTLGITLDVDGARHIIQRLQPDVVFNVVESIAGHGRLIHVACGLLDAMGVRYTGCSATAQFCTSNKVVAKQLLRGAGIATPDWFTLDELRQCPSLEGNDNASYILKSVWEHASIGLDEDSIIAPNSPEQLCDALEGRLGSLGGEGFAERYVDGREFNIGLLADAHGPQVLPPAEIVFHNYKPCKPKIVGYRAKWHEGAFEYTHTLRRYDFPQSDQTLLDTLQSIALQCWELFKLRGHARVDFRVDASGKPWVLEVNTNPCLSPDAGFAAALERAGIGFSMAIKRVLADVPCSSIAPQRPIANPLFQNQNLILT